MSTWPEAGQAVSIEAVAGRVIPTSVRRASEETVELELPPVIRAGATLTLVWAGATGALTATAEVLDGQSLCLRLGAPRTAERRAIARTRPGRALAVAAKRVPEAGRNRTAVRGALHDVSLGGIAFLTVGSVRVGEPVTLTLGEPMGQADLADIPARIVRISRCDDGRRLVSCAFTEPAGVGHAVRRLLAA